MRLNGHGQAEGLLTLSELIVEEELCLNLRGRVEHCTKCRDTCPSGALSLTSDSVDLDQDKCTGCNSCLPSCGAGALRSSGFVPERFIRAVAGNEKVHLHCRGSSDEGGGVVVPCHGALDARLLAAARAEGVESISIHGLDSCDSCSLGDARAHIESVTIDLQKWLGVEVPMLDCSPTSARQENERQYQDQPHLSRRSFLRFGGAKTVSQAVDWLVPALEQGEEDEEALPFYQTEVYPQRAAQYQQVLSVRADEVPWHAEVSLPWKLRSVSDRCSGCLSCGERCPTGALLARETNEVRELSFDVALCTDCTLCERICPEGAIVSKLFRTADLVESGRSLLLSMEQQLCSQCNTPFMPGVADGKICQVCSNEHDLDEEWIEMMSG